MVRAMTAASRASVLLVAAVTMVTAEALRVSGPLLDHVAGQGGVPVAAATALIVYLGPVLTGPLVGWLGARRATVAAVAVAVGLRLAVQVQSSPAFVTGVLLVAVALIAQVLVVRQASAPAADGGVTAAAGLVLGAGLDVAVRAALSSWDAAWRPGLAGWLVTVFECVFVLVTLARGHRSFVDRGHPVTGTARIALLGPYLALQTLVLGSVGFVASQSGVGLQVAVIALLAGALLAIEAVSRLRLPGGSGRLPELDGAAAGAVPAVLLVLSVIAAVYLTGPLVVLAVVVGQVAGAMLVARALTRRVEGAERGLTGFALAGLGTGLGYVIVVLLYQVHYEKPLPFPNTLLLFAAAVAVAVAGLGPRPASTHRSSSSGASPDEDDRDAVRRARRGHLAPFAGVPAILLLVPVLMLVTMPAPTDPPESTDSFRLVTWNLHYGVNNRAAVDPGTIGDVLSAQHPDVVLLQEVSRGWAIGGTTDLAEWLSRRLRMPYVWSPAADGQFGNLILSRLPMSEVDTGGLPQGDGTMRRSYAAATLELEGGRTVRVINAHLQHQDQNTPTRLRELDVVMRRWGGHNPAIIAGDFNSQPGWPEVRKLQDADLLSAQDTTGHAGLLTSPTDRPKYRVDWIFGTSDLSFTDFARPKTQASDHFPLSVEVRLG